MRIAALTAVVGTIVLAGCASGSSAATNGPSAAPEPSAMTADGGVRCAMIADSVRVATSLAKLPVATPRGRLVTPIPSSRPEGEIRTTFLVDPNGRAVPGTVRVTGLVDAGYAQQMEAAVQGVAFQVPKVKGCPSWGRGDIRLKAVTRVRRMG